MIHDSQNHFDITLMAQLLEVSRQGYYDWIDRPLSPSSVQREAVVQAIRQSHAQSHGRYGSPNINEDLLEQGIGCCLNTVARRMKEQGIVSIVHRKFRVTTTDSNHDHPVFENRLAARGVTPLRTTHSRSD